MGKITVDGFLREYSVAAKQQGSAMDMFIDKHITTKYVPYMTKCVYCDRIIKTTCHTKIGDKEIVKINTPSRYLYFTMRLIELYTDIEFAPEEVVQTYDKLNEVGAINAIITAIPKTEYNEFNTLLNMKLDDFYDNNYSVNALFSNFKDAFSISEEVIKEALKEAIQETQQTTNE